MSMDLKVVDLPQRPAEPKPINAALAAALMRVPPGAPCMVVWLEGDEAQVRHECRAKNMETVFMCRAMEALSTIPDR
jgi:hypothetical protein